MKYVTASSITTSFGSLAMSFAGVTDSVPDGIPHWVWLITTVAGPTVIHLFSVAASGAARIYAARVRAHALEEQKQADALEAAGKADEAKVLRLEAASDLGMANGFDKEADLVANAIEREASVGK